MWMLIISCSWVLLGSRFLFNAAILSQAKVTAIFFEIYVNNIFLGYVQLNVSAAFEDSLLYEISEDFCNLKCNFYVYRFPLESAAWLCC